MPFEINVPTLTGQITKAQLYEVGGVNPPTNAISASQTWGVDTEWKLGGFLAPLLPGDWKLELLMERMGPGSETIAPPPSGVSVHLADGASVPGGVSWAKKVEVGPGQVNRGTYHTILQLTWEPTAGSPGPIVGFADMGLVRVY